MRRSALTKKPGKKKFSPQLPRSYDTTKLGDEPTWEPVVDHHDKMAIIEALNWYAYFSDPKTSYKYLKDHYDGPIDIEPLDQLKVKKIPVMLGTVVRMQARGCRIPPESMANWEATLRHTLGLVGKADLVDDDDDDAPAEKVKKTAAERREEKFTNNLGFIEGVVDTMIADGYRTKFSMYAWMQEHELKKPQAQRVIEIYTPMVTELQAAYGKMDTQLVEAYSHLKRTELRRLKEFYEMLVTDAQRYIGVVKATASTRRKKPVSVEKKFQHFRYMKQDAATGVASEDPTKIPGCSEVWVYNAKYKKLTRFVADGPGGLDIRRSSITGWSESESMTKRLRKPDEILQEVLKAGKVARRKILPDLTTKETTTRDRTSEESIILRIIK